MALFIPSRRAARTASRSREGNRRAQNVNIDCRPVLCIKDDDCQISLKSYRASDAVNLTDIQNCVSGGSLRQACDLLVRQLGAFSSHLHDRVSRVAAGPPDRIKFNKIRFLGDNPYSKYDICILWKYKNRRGLPPEVYIKSSEGSMRLKDGEVHIAKEGPRNQPPRRMTWTRLLDGRSDADANPEEISRGEAILHGLYTSGPLKGDVEYNASVFQGIGPHPDFLDGGNDRMTLRFGKSRDRIVIPP